MSLVPAFPEDAPKEHRGNNTMPNTMHLARTTFGLPSIYLRRFQTSLSQSLIDVPDLLTIERLELQMPPIKYSPKKKKARK